MLARDQDPAAAAAAAAGGASKEVMPEYREVVDPSTGTTFFLNIATGAFQWDRPIDGIVQMRNPDGADDEWWELFDETRNLPYYYNTGTGQTEWKCPQDGVIIPLRALQNTSLGNQMSSALKRMSTMSATILGSNYSSEDEVTDNRSLLSSSREVQSPLGIVSSAISSTKERSATFSSANRNIRFEQLGMVAGGSSIAAASVGSSSSPRAGSNSVGMLPPSMLLPRESSNDARLQMQQQIQQHLQSVHQYNSSQYSQPQISPTSSNDQRQNRQTKKTVSDPPFNPLLATLPKVKPEIISPDESHLNKFKIDGFAKDHFTEQKKGLFVRHTMTMEEATMFQREPLRTPLMENLPKHLHRDAIRSFRLIRHIMFDTSTGPPYNGSIREVQALLNLGVTSKFLRDEIYVQICKQVRGNILAESVFRGWLLLCVIAIVFPPSKDFEEYMKSFTLEHFDGVPIGSWGSVGVPPWGESKTSRENEAIAILAKYCHKKLIRICRVGARGKTPLLQEIERAQEAPFRASLFGETLEDIMAVQAKENPKDSAGRKLVLPRILLFLTDTILSLNGCQTEGIFRVPGDIDLVNDLRIRLERGKYDMTGIQDPHVPSSLLKLWLRELAEPLIPANLYFDCILIGKEAMLPDSNEDVGVLAYEVLNEMPDINRKVALYMLKFLKVVADEKNQHYTRMTHANIALVFAPNFLRCPSDDPVIIFENTKYEQSFIRVLLTRAPS